MSAGWTNERHSTFISSMEASFLGQLYGLENHMINVKRSHLGGNAIRFEGADVRMHDGVARSLPDDLLIRRFRPPNAGLNRRGDGAEDSVDDYGSGTDTVREKVRIHGRRAKGFAEGNFIEVSDQNFSEEKVNVEANDEPHKKRKPTSRVVPNDQST